MNETNHSRRRSRRRQTKPKWLRAGKNTLLFSLLAVLGAGAYLGFTALGKHEAPKATPAPEPVAAPEPTVRLSFVGDVMMAGNVENVLLEKGYDYPFTHVRSLFLQDDYTIANLETPLTTRGTPADNKAYVYKSSPLAAPAMQAAGIDAVNLANNHSMDQGVDGLLDTFAALEEHRIAYVGGGVDATRAFAPVFVEKNGIRLAVLGFSRVIPEVSWFAQKNGPGLAGTYDPALAVQAIEQAKAQADLVVVIAHWGKEREDFPVDHQKELAKAYIDAGADLIVGGHPHVLQGFEQYRGKWIAYSLGNFIFTRSTEPKTWETMVLQASCTKNAACDLTMLPFHAELGQAVPMNATDGAALRKRIESLSENVQIDTEGRVRGS
ncbi:CapA family protein [Brevibacillus agri]|uniref:CapA family protein n=1 Tax=Brevibacillus agri TaxID=51101 RepID=UPI002E219795|nr:CapA family protein [Brevibacillus agri]